MKILLFVQLLLISLFPQQDAFLKTVLTDFGRHSNYVCLKVEYGKKQKEIIIENLELYYYFHENKKMNDKDYLKFMLANLKAGKVIRLDNPIRRNKYYYQELNTKNKMEQFYSKRVEEIASKGKKYFMDYYFEAYLMKTDVPWKEQKYIIKKLFEWKITSNTDDYSGYLRYGYAY